MKWLIRQPPPSTIWMTTAVSRRDASLPAAGFGDHGDVLISLLWCRLLLLHEGSRMPKGERPFDVCFVPPDDTKVNEINT